MKIAAVGDIHCRVDSPSLVRDLLGPIEENADILILAGDLTDTGLPAEINTLIPQLQALTIPVVAILGNHDHESGYADELGELLVDGGVHLLDATAYEYEGVSFIGTKGFCGGFGNNLVQPFGEAALKTFIRTSIDEAADLESVLSAARSPHKVVVLHYAPIPETVAGEPPEIYPFLGTSRLADAIDRWGADVIIHGHSHHGYPEGRTAGNIPVYNVCRFVQTQYTGKPYHMIELQEVKV